VRVHGLSSSLLRKSDSSGNAYPHGRAHAQSPGHPVRFAYYALANRISLYKQVYMMSWAKPCSIAHVQYHMDTQSAASRDGLCTTTMCNIELFDYAQQRKIRVDSTRLYLAQSRNHRLQENPSRVRLVFNQAQSSQCSSLRPRSISPDRGKETTLLLTPRQTKEIPHSFTTLQHKVNTFLHNLGNYFSREPTYSVRSWGAQAHLYCSYQPTKQQKRSKPCLPFC
jgi:hypothetical protein